MNTLIALLLFCLTASAANAELSVTLAETEIHSTAGIANSAPSTQYDQSYPHQESVDENPEYLEEYPEREELAPPTTIEHLSPTRSKTITRTTSRPSSKNSQPVDVGITPVIVPVDGNQNGHHAPRPVFLDTPPPTRR